MLYFIVHIEQSCNNGNYTLRVFYGLHSFWISTLDKESRLVCYMLSVLQ